jgi:hypothetical protein
MLAEEEIEFEIMIRKLIRRGAERTCARKLLPSFELFIARVLSMLTALHVCEREREREKRRYRAVRGKIA